jgi:hypothetical protein
VEAGRAEAVPARRRIGMKREIRNPKFEIRTKLEQKIPKREK